METAPPAPTFEAKEIPSLRYEYIPSGVNAKPVSPVHPANKFPPNCSPTSNTSSPSSSLPSITLFSANACCCTIISRF
ncbi:MAG: hypothetical protein BWY67_02391 [Bacteroidetes bacterium ADurb.Bin397]|nr:MAG: hypothetical protein BWY67_02391 [Bacteroidetes bacterium ADurb.Bin397]